LHTAIVTKAFSIQLSALSSQLLAISFQRPDRSLTVAALFDALADGFDVRHDGGSRAATGQKLIADS
jgi:hypothetical protein